MDQSTYNRKRRFEETPEPAAPTWEGDVDPTKAPPGDLFVIHQHYATRLHHDLRLEMFNGSTPVLVSWAVPKRLPGRKGQRHLAVRTEDHPYEYATFSGPIPEGNYGAGEVRIFDTGAYEIVDRDDRKISFRLEGRRARGVYHIVKTRGRGGKEEWLVLLGEDRRPQPDERPPAKPMLASVSKGPFDDPGWSFEPLLSGIRAISIFDETTSFVLGQGTDLTANYPEFSRLDERLVAFDAMLDGVIVDIETPATYMIFDLLYLDGQGLVSQPFSERRRLLEEALVPSNRIQLSPRVVGDGEALLEAAIKQGLQGIVAKEHSSQYKPGARTKSWLEIKAGNS